MIAHRARAILIDERIGRAFAVQEGLQVVGTLTVLELAAERELLELPKALQKLQQTSFRISQAYLDAALARDAARRRS